MDVRRPADALALLLVGLAMAAAAVVVGLVGPPDLFMPRVSAQPLGQVVATLVTDVPEAWTADPYTGLGTWVDSYDADPAYAPGGLTVVPHDTASMAAAGVGTLYLQASRSDDRATGLTTDPWVLAEFLLNAHQDGMDVVAWYLPKWSIGHDDINRLEAIRLFEVLGHRFDGLAVDIEWNRDGLEPEERSRRLLVLSKRLRSAVGDDPIGGIVMPPIVTDEINTGFWPGFPWTDLAPLYDVWLPMSYWSFRTEEHADPRFYSSENIRLLRANLGDSGAAVHGIGGIGATDGDVRYVGEPLAVLADMDLFVDSLVDAGAVGGSIYDWATTGDAARARLAGLFAERGIG